MRRLISILLVIVAGFVLFGCSSSQPEPTQSEHVFAKIVIADYGEMTVELYPEKAPITVANFVDLVNQGYYDGIPIHRVYPGFVIQGGAGSIAGKGEVPTIKGEFSANGVANDLHHTRGAISMARVGGQNDSASSQFFICVDDCRLSLDTQYACFGYVTEGMETADKICEKVTNIDSNGFVQDINQMPVIESIRIIQNTEG